MKCHYKEALAKQIEEENKAFLSEHEDELTKKPLKEVSKEFYNRGLNYWNRLLLGTPLTDEQKQLAFLVFRDCTQPQQEEKKG